MQHIRKCTSRRGGGIPRRKRGYLDDSLKAAVTVLFTGVA